MEFIDLGAVGSSTFQRFFDPNPLPAGRPELVEPVDEQIREALVGTPFRVGAIELDASPDPNDFHVRRTPLIVHPELGAWFVEMSHDEDIFPDFEEWRFETYFQAWCIVAETFGWAEPPMRPLIIYGSLDRSACIADFDDAPFEVLFRDDLPRLPEILQESADSVGREVVTSLMGALQAGADLIMPDGQRSWIADLTPPYHELWAG